MERDSSEKDGPTPTHGVGPSGEVWAGQVTLIDHDKSIHLQKDRNDPPPKGPKKKKKKNEKKKQREKRKSKKKQKGK